MPERAWGFNSPLAHVWGVPGKAATTAVSVSTRFMSAQSAAQVAIRELLGQTREEVREGHQDRTDRDGEQQ